MDGIYMGNWVWRKTHSTRNIISSCNVRGSAANSRSRRSNPPTLSIFSTTNRLHLLTDRTRRPFTVTSCALQHQTPSKHPSTAHNLPQTLPPKRSPIVSPPPIHPPSPPNIQDRKLPPPPRPAQPSPPPSTHPIIPPRIVCHPRPCPSDQRQAPSQRVSHASEG